MNDRPEHDLQIDLSVPCDKWMKALPEAEALCRRAAEAAYGAVSKLGDRETEVSLVLADDALLKQLNRDYRGKDKPTDVLSFPAWDPANPGRERPLVLGDIIVAYETASDDAKSDGTPLGDHLSHLVVHGMLHLFGHDHEMEADAERMERLEIKVLAGLGIADPYGSAL
jgi:probable rRNA maturation factor